MGLVLVSPLEHTEPAVPRVLVRFVPGASLLGHTISYAPRTKPPPDSPRSPLPPCSASRGEITRPGLAELPMLPGLPWIVTRSTPTQDSENGEAPANPNNALLRPLGR